MYFVLFYLRYLFGIQMFYCGTITFLALHEQKLWDSRYILNNIQVFRFCHALSCFQFRHRICYDSRARWEK